MKPLPERVYCLCEDRPGAVIHLELLLLSLERFQPGSRVVLHRENPEEEVRGWPARFPFLSLEENRPGAAPGWDCKPHVLLRHLDAGVPEAIWLDSDLLALRSLEDLMSSLSPEVFVIAQEPRSANHGDYTTESRTAAWALEVGREIPMVLNSCILRATQRHTRLLRRWCELMRDENYRREADRPREERAAYFFGDQDALSALLASPEFADIPLRVLTTGRDIIQSSGPLAFTLRERWRCHFGPGPWAVHAIDIKPWIFLQPSQTRRNGSALERLFAETSPYTWAARHYLAQTSASRVGWMRAQSLLGGLLNLLSFGQLSLRGGHLTLAATVVRWLQPLPTDGKYDQAIREKAGRD